MVAALLPFPRGSQVSGTGGWGHLASGVGGVLEHWAMAFTPSHAIINIAIDKVIRNMAQPYDPNGKKKKGDASMCIQGVVLTPCHKGYKVSNFIYPVLTVYNYPYSLRNHNKYFKIAYNNKKTQKNS